MPAGEWNAACLVSRARRRQRSETSRVGQEPPVHATIDPVPTNYELAFAERPDVLAAWGQLNGAIKAGMDLRRYELATLAAARRLRSSYCCLAHGSVLLNT